MASHRGGIYAGEGGFFPIHPGSAKLSEDMERSCFALRKNVNIVGRRAKPGGVHDIHALRLAARATCIIVSLAPSAVVDVLRAASPIGGQAVAGHTPIQNNGEYIHPCKECTSSCMCINNYRVSHGA